MRGRRKLFLGLAALTLWTVSDGLGAAAPGQLDTSFGTGGQSLVNLGGNEYGRDVALRPDGRIVVAGNRTAGLDLDALVVQLLQPQGTLDTSYGGGSGWSRVDFGGSDIAYALALQPDGRVVVTGQRTLAGTTASDAVVARLTSPGGIFDASFGTGGRSILDYGGADTSFALALQPNGRIVVGGGTFVTPAGNATVARLIEPQGIFDPSYGAGFGWSLLDFGGQEATNGIALQPDGRIVTVASSTIANVRDVVVARLTEPGGTFDPTFGGGTGQVRIDFGGFDIGEDVVLQPDGKIVVAGSGGPGDGDMAIARLNPGGTLDGTFGAGGRVFVDFGGADDISGLALQPDGKLVAVGTTYKAMSGNFAVARLQPNGLLDATFGTAGRTEVDLGGDDSAWETTLRPDGRIVAVGESRKGLATSDVAVAQLQGDPAPPGPLAPVVALAPTCAGRPATIVGTAARDVLRGTPGPDVIAALAGNDVVRGARGKDLVCGGPGADRLLGGPGPDRLLGGPGPDRLLGGLGADRLFGGLGRDRLVGGLGRDFLRGGLGPDAQTQ
jgi:uncharacterized delta-60 repeat protein